eukprot:NODE_190_length_13461_cov_0.525595.p2 type:complete len:388 gc:universal NODE_190_length_13461_cov_0.525595:7149-8312(+)
MLLPLTLLYARVNHEEVFGLVEEGALSALDHWGDVMKCQTGDQTACNVLALRLSDVQLKNIQSLLELLDRVNPGQLVQANWGMSNEKMKNWLVDVGKFFTGDSTLPNVEELVKLLNKGKRLSKRHNDQSLGKADEADEENQNVEPASESSERSLRTFLRNLRHGIFTTHEFLPDTQTPGRWHRAHTGFHDSVARKMRKALANKNLLLVLFVGILVLVGAVGGMAVGSMRYNHNKNVANNADADRNKLCNWGYDCPNGNYPPTSKTVEKWVNEPHCYRSKKSIRYDSCYHLEPRTIVEAIKNLDENTGEVLTDALKYLAASNQCTVTNAGELQGEDAVADCMKIDGKVDHLDNNAKGWLGLLIPSVFFTALALCTVIWSSAALALDPY